MFLDNEIKSTPSRNIRSRKDRSILDPKQQHQVARLCMIPFQNACTIGPESFVYNCWTNPKNFFASKHTYTSVQGFLAQAQEDATLLTFATKFPSLPPALLVLLFRKLWNFQLYRGR